MTALSPVEQKIVAVAQQIEAVVWAKNHIEDAGRRARLRPPEIDELRRRLEAAVETLETIDFMRETLK